MDNYRKFLADLADRKENRTFLNSDTEHAVAVMVQIFKSAQSTVRIFAGTLCGKVGDAPEFIEAMSNFIEKGGELKVLLNDYKEEYAKNSRLFMRIAYYLTESKPIYCKRTEERPYFTNDSVRQYVHFTIGDESSFRIETDIDARKAIGNFNQPEIASKYAAFFDDLFGKSEDIDIKGLFNL